MDPTGADNAILSSEYVSLFSDGPRKVGVGLGKEGSIRLGAGTRGRWKMKAWFATSFLLAPGVGFSSSGLRSSSEN